MASRMAKNGSVPLGRKLALANGQIPVPGQDPGDLTETVTRPLAALAVLAAAAAGEVKPVAGKPRSGCGGIRSEPGAVGLAPRTNRLRTVAPGEGGAQRSGCSGCPQPCQDPCKQSCQQPCQEQREFWLQPIRSLLVVVPSFRRWRAGRPFLCSNLHGQDSSRRPSSDQGREH